MERETRGKSEHEIRCELAGLRNYEMYMHDDLMNTPMAHWPESLKEMIEEARVSYGLSGGVISDIVANWIRKKV